MKINSYKMLIFRLLKPLLWVAALALLVGCGGGTMGSQTGGGVERNLSGFVRDTNGRAVKDADVTVVNAKTPVQTSTGSEGEFELSANFDFEQNSTELLIQKDSEQQSFSSSAVIEGVPLETRRIETIIAVDTSQIGGRATVIDVQFDSQAGSSDSDDDIKSPDQTQQNDSQSNETQSGDDQSGNGDQNQPSSPDQDDEDGEDGGDTNQITPNVPTPTPTPPVFTCVTCFDGGGDDGNPPEQNGGNQLSDLEGNGPSGGGEQKNQLIGQP